MKRLQQSDLDRLVRTVGAREPDPGTAAHDYISGKLSKSGLEADPRLLGGVQFPDGLLIVFKDGSSLMNAKPDPGETVEQLDERLRRNSAAMIGNPGEA